MGALHTGKLTSVTKWRLQFIQIVVSPYGGLREKRFLLPFWEKRGFGAKTPPKISLVNLIKAFDTNILSI